MQSGESLATQQNSQRHKAELELALYELKKKLMLSKEEFMEIYSGELICDAKGNFAGYPKIEKELKNEIQNTIVREKIIQLKQLHFLKAKKDFLDALVKNDDVK